MYPSVKRQIDQIAEMAKTNFAGHQIEVRLDHGLFRNWRCAKPDTGSYAFNISTEPGRLFVTGDVGCMIWEREPDMITWARQAIKDIDYMAGKVPSEIKTRQWDVDTACDWITDQVKEATIDEDREMIGKLATLREWMEGQPSESDFCQALWDGGIIHDSDFPRCHCWTPSFLWCREAVAWLLSRLDERTGKIKPIPEVKSS